MCVQTKLATFQTTDELPHRLQKSWHSIISQSYAEWTLTIAHALYSACVHFIQHKRNENRPEIASESSRQKQVHILYRILQSTDARVVMNFWASWEYLWL